MRGPYPRRIASWRAASSACLLVICLSSGISFTPHTIPIALSVCNGYFARMPPPVRFPESVLFRLPAGTRERIAALIGEAETLADAQRRVVLAGLAALERQGKSPAQKPSARPAKARKR